MIKCNSCSLEKEETEFSIRKDGSIGKYRKTCKKCKNSNQRKNYKKYKTNNPFLARHIKMKANCKKKGIPYNLDELYLKQIWTDYCPVSGVKLEWSTGQKQQGNPNSAELDRFIPSLGYVKGNVSWICRRMNNLKGDGTIEDFKKILDWMQNWEEPKIKILEKEIKAERSPAWNKNLKYENKDIVGEKNPMSKLTADQVKEIKQNFTGKRGQYVYLAKKYNISAATVRKIINGITWKEVQCESRR